MHVAFLLQWPRVARGQAAVFRDARSGIMCQSSDPNNENDQTSNTTATNVSDTNIASIDRLQNLNKFCRRSAKFIYKSK